MIDLFLHNPYLRGLRVPLSFEVILLTWMYLTRNPRPSFIAALFNPNSLSDPGTRTRKLHDVLCGIIVVWIFVALVLGAVRQFGWLS
jgi:hypothetical protein